MSTLLPPSLPMNPRYSSQPIASTSNLNSISNPSIPSSASINDALGRDFPDISSTLSREEMTNLLEDDNYFDAYFNTTPQALELQNALELRLKGNIELAQSSEAMKPDLDRLRSETSNVFNEAIDLKMRWSLIEEAQNDAYKRFTPTPQLNRLRAATSLQEHLSETLVNNFIDGSMEEESFSKQYREIRKVFHTRDINLSKWEEGKVVWR